ncbi:unnamed protein product [Dicrocoelium dendriticum]|nr:unnamed protein product [Dicrocoelium dendriticum]
MGIFKLLKSSKPPLVVKELNQFLKFTTKLAEAKCCVQFFNDCVEHNEYPTRFWKQLRRDRIYPNSKTLRRHALNQRDTVQSKIAEYERNLAQRHTATDELAAEEKKMFLDYVQLITSNRVQRRRSSLAKSLSQLKPQATFPNRPDRYVHNFSSLNLDTTLIEVLSLGLKFCAPRRRDNRLECELQFESLYDQTKGLVAKSNTDLERFKCYLVNCCYQYRKLRVRNHGPLTRRHLDALKELKRNEEIVLCKPDKGAGIVLLDRKDYIDKLTAILSDETKFACIEGERDRTEQVETQITKSLQELRTKGYISDALYDSLKPSGTSVPRLYGLPKIHKPNIPLRPILSMVNSPYHAVAQWLVELLEPVRQQLAIYSLRDSFHFVESIKDDNINEKLMLSFDVVSLFTNVPLLETIDYICDYIAESGIKMCIPTRELKSLLLRCTWNVQFLFNGKYYRQKDGVAMGSPLGPLLADIFMAKLERNEMRAAIDLFDRYHRYMDDIFVVVDKHVNLEEILDHFNRVHAAVQFTYEKESDNRLPYLDVLLTRRPDGSIQRQVYRKPTWIGQYTNFYSFVPMRYKRNLVHCLTSRARRICTEDTLDAELMFIQNTLRENGYPDRFILRNLLEKPKPVAVLTAPKKELFIRLPFKGDAATERLTRSLSAAVKSTFPAASLKCVFSTEPLIRSQNKDKLPMLTTSMVIYQFVCACGATYIGRTARQLSKRVNEHCPRWLRQGGIGIISSAILAHIVDTGHEVDWKRAFRIVYKVPPHRTKGYRLRMLATAEAICIRLFQPSLCSQKKLVQALQLPWPAKMEDAQVDCLRSDAVANI